MTDIIDNEFLLNSVLTFRVRTVEDALALRDRLQGITCAELVNFSYTTKPIKEKGEIVDEYQVVKAKLHFTEEKEPDQMIPITFG